MRFIVLTSSLGELIEDQMFQFYYTDTTMQYIINFYN